jgi:hypothetical protein
MQPKRSKRNHVTATCTPPPERNLEIGNQEIDADCIFVDEMCPFLPSEIKTHKVFVVVVLPIPRRGAFAWIK